MKFLPEANVSAKLNLTIFTRDNPDESETHGAEKTEKVPWFKLLKYKQTWAFSFGKFMTDGVWWFYLFWLPAYLKAQYGMTGMQVAFPLAVLYTMSTVGSITGGWFPMYFIKKGYEPYAGRMKAMLIIALVPLLVLSAQYLGGISYLDACIYYWNRNSRPPGMVGQYFYNGFRYVSQKGSCKCNRNRRNGRRIWRHFY